MQRQRLTSTFLGRDLDPSGWCLCFRTSSWLAPLSVLRSPTRALWSCTLFQRPGHDSRMTRAIDAAGMSDSAPSSSSDEADIHTLANIATARWQHHHAHRRSPASQPRTVVQRSTDDQGAPDVHASSSSAAAAAAARSSAPSRHDRRASKACQACRARKTRCDAQQPKCSYCRKHDIDCHYVAGDLRKQRPSKRRRSSPQPDHARDDSDPPPPPSPPAHRLPLEKE